MIYLIDDKRKRQIDDFGWPESRFKKFDSILHPIYTLAEITEFSKEIFKKGNVVIYHESFLDISVISREAAEKRNKLLDFASVNPNFHLAIFSGSKEARLLEQNVAYLPVSIVYQNLEVFAEKFAVGESNLEYLLFGKNPQIEKELSDKLNKALLEIDLQPAKLKHHSNLFLRPVKDNIQDPVENADVKTLFNKDVTDEKFTEYINDWFAEKCYDNVFVPISFGPTLSDFNGLRLATHIRCTPSASQLSNIIIYSYVSIEHLLDNEFFNILKTKNVFLVNFRKKAFEEIANTITQALTIEELPREIAKLKLDPPKNYEDSHSVVNEWAIHRWASILDAEHDEELEKVFNTVKTNLFFKYLKTVYPVSTTEKISKHELKIDYNGNPRILLIDDDSHKGWYELFACLLGDINNIYTDFIGDGFKNLTREQIIVQSIQKIKDDEIDVVILDFRLHPDDFNIQNINNVTGLKLLKEIKKLNPGIQVIVFSATNKVWNLQAIQQAGADGFIVKVSPENTLSIDFTKDSVVQMTDSLKACIKKSFLKEIFNGFQSLFNHVELLENIKPESYSNNDYPVPQGNILRYVELLKSCKVLLLSNWTELNLAFLQLILIIEDLVKTFYIEKEDKNHYIVKSLFESTLVLDKQDGFVTLKLEPKSRWNDFKLGEFEVLINDRDYKYFDVNPERVLFNYRLFCVLLFKYHIELDKIKKYSTLYQKRSKVVAHLQDKNTVINNEDIIDAIELLSILFDKIKLS